MSLLQSYFITNKKTLYSYLVLLIVCFVGYWPLSLQIFSIKNDAIHYFLPFRYNISCAIQNGEFPFWSPYIYLGYPVHGDMQSGAWNPFVQLISIFTTYNIYVFHYEYLLYIFLAGVGMYKLTGNFSQRNEVKLFAAFSYMLCGYMYGSGQFINWIASATFIPFVLHYYYQFLQHNKTSFAVKTALAYWLLFVCGYPADVIYLFYVLAAVTITAIVINRKNKNLRLNFKKYIGNHLFLAVVFLGLAAPAIISYIELLPYYNRGEGTTYNEAIINSYSINSVISFLNPWSVFANDFNTYTDPTGRNIFIGIIPLSFFIAGVFTKNSFAKNFLLIVLIISFLFSLGDGFLVRKLFYNVVPGMSQFRHPSHFRLYVILCMLLIGAVGFENFIKTSTIKTFKYSLVFFIIIALLLSTFHFKENLLQLTNSFPFDDLNNINIKNWLDKIDFSSITVVGLFIQVLFIVTGLIILKKKEKRARNLLILSIFNLFIFQSLFPVNFVSKTNPSTIHSIIEKRIESSKDFHQTLFKNSEVAFDNFETASLAYFYNGKPSISKITNSPSFLQSQDQFINNDFLYNYVGNKPFAYFSDNYLSLKDTALSNISTCNFSYTDKTEFLNRNCNSDSRIEKVEVGYNYLKFDVKVSDTTIFNLSQNYFHNWQATANGKEQKIIKTNIAFMSIKLLPGKYNLEWKYRPVNVLIGLATFGITVCFLIFYWIVLFRRKKITKSSSLS